MITDIFLHCGAFSGGFIYGLFAADEPLQIRYVGQTSKAPEVRLAEHLADKNSRSVDKREWIQEVKQRGSEIGLRILGNYPLKDLNKAEHRWLLFWAEFCSVLNCSKDRARHAPKR